MSGASLEFEPPDLASWLWVAVLVMALAEGARYVTRGRRPAGWRSRAVLVGAVAAGVAALRIAGWLRLDESSHGWACVWLGVGGSCWALRSYRRTTRPIALRVRWGLLALRLSAVGVVLLMLARPVLQSVEVVRDRAVVGILLDDSRSMTVKDVTSPEEGERGEPISRLDAVRRALSSNRGLLDRLGEQLDLRWFRFWTSLKEVDSPGIEGNGEHTAVMDSVERAHALLGQVGRRLAGVVVVSDGRDNFSAGRDASAVGEALASAGVPIYAVGVGSEVPIGQTRSVQARRLDVPARVGVLNRLPVHAEFMAAGLAGTPIEVELRYDNEVVGQRQVTPAGVRELVTVDLAHVPEAGGVHRVTVRAQVAGSGGERNGADMSQFVRVTDDKIHVLYIDRARYERAAIARALGLAKEVRVTTVELDEPVDQAARPAVGAADRDWRVYHVVVLGDVARPLMPASVLRAIRNLVIEEGHGLAMLGGVRTLGSGEYRDTDLQEVVPADLGVVGQRPAPVEFALTRSGRVHAICRLSPDEKANGDRWKHLPPFNGASGLGRVSPAAEVLIRSSAGEPLLVVQEVGKGRAAAVAFDSTWRWSFADEQGREAQRRFWRQLVLWLANRRPDVWVTSSKPRYELARLRLGVEQVTLEGGAIDPTTGEMPADVTLSAAMTGPHGPPRPIQWVRKSDRVEAQVSAEEAGEYRVSVVARTGEAVVGQSETAFVVESADVEMSDPIADLETLRQLAGRTGAVGGVYVPIDQFGRLLESLQAAQPVTETKRYRRRYLMGDRPWGWLVVFVGLAGVEWFLRRRAGLV